MSFGYSHQCSPAIVAHCDKFEEELYARRQLRLFVSQSIDVVDTSFVYKTCEWSRQRKRKQALAVKQMISWLDWRMNCCLHRTAQRFFQCEHMLRRRLNQHLQQLVTLHLIGSVENNFNPRCESDEKFLHFQKCERITIPNDMHRHIHDRILVFYQRIINI